MPFGGCYLVVVTLVFRNKVTAVGINLGIVAKFSSSNLIRLRSMVIVSVLMYLLLV